MLVGYDNSTWFGGLKDLSELLDNIKDDYLEKLVEDYNEVISPSSGHTFDLNTANETLEATETILSSLVNAYIQFKPSFGDEIWNLILAETAREEDLTLFEARKMIAMNTRFNKASDMAEKFSVKFSSTLSKYGFIADPVFGIKRNKAEMNSDVQSLLAMARLLDLYRSRGERNVTNDVLLNWMWTRENGGKFSSYHDDPDDRYFLITDRFPSVDRDNEQGSDLAVGYGEKHLGNFIASVSGLGWNLGDLKKWENYLWITHFAWPWWAQSFLVDGEINYTYKSRNIPKVSRVTLKQQNWKNVYARDAFYWQFWSGQPVFINPRAKFTPFSVGWRGTGMTLHSVAMKSFNLCIRDAYDWSRFKSPYAYLVYGEPMQMTGETDFYPDIILEDYDKLLASGILDISTTMSAWGCHGGISNVKALYTLFVQRLKMLRNSLLTEEDLRLQAKGPIYLTSEAPPTSFTIKFNM